MAGVALILAAGCAPRAGTLSSAGPAPAVATLMHGFWSGQAKKTPQGIQPYAISFQVEGTSVVGETPAMLGEEKLPPGAYQRFVFEDGAAGRQVEYKTAMGDKGVLEGTLLLAAEKSTKTKMVFCEPHACEKIELQWEALDASHLSFRAVIDGKLHADIVLEFGGDP